MLVYKTKSLEFQHSPPEWKLRVKNIAYNIIKQNLKVRDFQNENGIMKLVALSLLSWIITRKILCENLYHLPLKYQNMNSEYEIYEKLSVKYNVVLIIVRSQNLFNDF